MSVTHWWVRAALRLDESSRPATCTRRCEAADPRCFCPAPLLCSVRQHVRTVCGAALPGGQGSLPIYVHALTVSTDEQAGQPCSRTEVPPPPSHTHTPLPIYEVDDCAVRSLKVSWRDFLFPYSTLMRCYTECKFSRF